jgi:hypothetical protein
MTTPATRDITQAVLREDYGAINVEFNENIREIGPDAFYNMNILDQ